MALVTVQRSPSIGNSPQSSEDSGAGSSLDEDEAAKNCRSLSECYFAGKGAALVLPPNERAPHTPDSRPQSTASGSSDIQQHLQSMFYLLRPQETLKMAVKLESVHVSRTRYLVVVSCLGRQQAEESCLLGIDCNARTSVGLVLRVLADTAITLDGDGGFSVSVSGRQHIFKPVSVQAMWSALQTLHKVSSKAREQNYFLGGLTHEWVSYYEQRIESDRSCLNEWHAMDSIESRRPPSPDSCRTKPMEGDETERVIRSALKEIMMSLDLDDVTSKQVRSKLEEALDMDLGEYKPFIDQEMLVILGQMDAATEIFPHVYLGSEWNASNLEELNKNGICHILNVTREIDNFFPGMFEYLNIRVYDDEKTDLLKHWDNTYKYITKAKKQGSKVLVHCKMGVSRSASVVIAYAMKAYNWDLKKALEYVRKKRNCVKPNSSFIAQLETYQGILDAMKNKEKLQRSKSETNLKTNGRESMETGTDSSTNGNIALDSGAITTGTRSVSEGEGDGLNKQDSTSLCNRCRRQISDEDSHNALHIEDDLALHPGGRPKSWSPDHTTANTLFPVNTSSGSSASLERLTFNQQQHQQLPRETHNYNVNVRMPCGNSLTYSVSQNKILHLPCSQSASVKHRVNALESANAAENSPNTVNLVRKGLVLNLTSQFEEPATTLVKNEQVWEPTETNWEVVKPMLECRTVNSSNSNNNSNRKLHVEGDVFSNKLDRLFDREERKQKSGPNIVAEDEVISEISRQSSWSSFDSAVILRDCVSRQSSWGSADIRTCTLPSRNSSWGSYDLRVTQPNHEPYTVGTVKRTKQKLEEGDTVKRVCANHNSCRNCDDSRSTSVKEEDEDKVLLDVKKSSVVSNKEIVTAEVVSNSNNINSNNSSNTISGSTLVTRRLGSDKSEVSTKGPVHLALNITTDNQKSSIYGKVKNLKKEFEAKVGLLNSRNDRFSDNNNIISEHDEPKVRSLPTSPVSEVGSQKPSPAPSLEDLSVRKLVGRYEHRPKFNSGTENRLSHLPVPPRKSSLDVQPVQPQTTLPPLSTSTPTNSSTESSSFSSCISHELSTHTNRELPVLLKYSSLFINSNFKNNQSQSVVKVLKSPPPSAKVVVASVVAKATTKKQQQGTTHPLTRLALNKQRHSNPVYNTM